MSLVLTNASANEATLEALLESAQSQIAKRQITDGIGALERALEVARSNGEYDYRQYGVLRLMVDARSLIGDLDGVLDDLARMEDVSGHTHGRRFPSHARALVEIADWHCRIGSFARARALYRQAIELDESRKDSSALLDALSAFARCCTRELISNGIATSPDVLDTHRGPVDSAASSSVRGAGFHRRVRRMFSREGEEALRRAVRIADEDGTSARQRILIRLQAGDWHQAKGDLEAAQRLYSAADAEVVRTAAAGSLFATPVYVLYPVPPTELRAHNPFGDGLKQIVEFELTVTAEGRPAKIRLISGNHEAAIEETRTALAAARFRPRFERGKPVATQNVRFRQIFHVFI